MCGAAEAEAEAGRSGAWRVLAARGERRSGMEARRWSRCEVGVVIVEVEVSSPAEESGGEGGVWIPRREETKKASGG